MGCESMRILLINEFIVMGGTEVQTFRERDYFVSQGHDVYILTFDPEFPLQIEGKEQNYPIHLNIFQKFLCKFHESENWVEKIKNIIQRIEPDVIHVNNLFALPNVVMKAVESYQVVQTIRDYGAVCPKSTCIYKNGAICRGYRFENCKKCIGVSPLLRFRFMVLKHYNLIRKISVNQFVSPSQALADVCSSNAIPTRCLNNPFDFSKIISCKKTYGEKKIYLYYGVISEIKGIRELFSAFESFSINKGVKLWLAGKVMPGFKKEFEILLKNSAFAVYLGVKKFDEMMELYPEVYCVIAPSLWIENYPNTVLEALANKTIVIGSNRGGIPELIQNDKYCFNILDKNDFCRCLNDTYVLTVAEYISLTEKNYMRIVENNSQKTYYMKLVNIYDEIKKS